MRVRRRCHLCHTPLEADAGQPVTVDVDGTYRRWTPERAAYFARIRQEARLVALCPACDAREPAEVGQDRGEASRR